MYYYCVYCFYLCVRGVLGGGYVYGVVDVVECGLFFVNRWVGCNFMFEF